MAKMRRREAIEAVAARLLYPLPYSPDFNSIEQVLFKTKALLRTATARTADDLTIAIHEAFAAFKQNECRNYLTAAGYDTYDPSRPGKAPSLVQRLGCVSELPS